MHISDEGAKTDRKRNEQKMGDICQSKLHPGQHDQIHVFSLIGWIFPGV
jgi:hypothetical protein